jgi:hypothetical protein
VVTLGSVGTTVAIPVECWWMKTTYATTATSALAGAGAEDASTLADSGATRLYPGVGDAIAAGLTAPHSGQ